MRVSNVGIFVTAVIFGTALAAPAQVIQTPLNSTSIPQFVDPLPILSAGGGTMATVPGNGPLTLRMCEFDANVLPTGTFLAGVKPATRVWGYAVGTCPATIQDTYIGPVILNTRGTPTSMTFINDLGGTASSQLLAYKQSTDQTLHWADPLDAMCNDRIVAGLPPTPECAQNYAGSIPAVVHLHGGEVPPELDGGPNAWFTSDGSIKGPGYYSFAGAPSNGAIYNYPNTQESAPAWFHDHTLGATRLNVYAGLAGAYLISDPDQTLPAGLHPYGLSYAPATSLDLVTIPVVIQDRMFDTTGQLFFPNAGINPEHPYWIPEFMGDTIVVNGKAWPYLNVEPKRYRFLVLNGSNARTYTLSFAIQGKGKSPTFWQIGTDGGYLDAPVPMASLTIMPGERQDVIVDFGAIRPGTSMILTNSAKSPFPAGSPPQGTTVGQIMQVRVGPCASAKCGVADTSYNPALGTQIRATGQQIVRLVNPTTGTLAAGVTVGATRQLSLNEVVAPRNKVAGVQYSGGPLEILVNNTKWAAAVTETPKEGSTEVWEIVNLTADAHPIHLHLVQFQLMNRQAYDAKNYTAAYNLAFPGGLYLPGFGPPLNYTSGNPRTLGGNPDITLFLMGAAAPPAPNEAGWKDTVIMYPGQVTRIAVRWAPTGLPIASTPVELAFSFDPSGVSADGPRRGYVWHCHIIDHEDNEMMRPDVVELNPAAPAPGSRPLVKGLAY